jgi:hypothetical protein
MSAIGTKQTFQPESLISAFGGKADIPRNSSRGSNGAKLHNWSGV